MIFNIMTGGETVVDWMAKGTNTIVQNIQTLLNIYPYEVAYNRTLGIDSRMVDAPMSQMKDDLIFKITELIEEKEPRARVQSVEVGATTAGVLSVEVVIEIE